MESAVDRTAEPHSSMEIAALRLHLMVGMAAADDTICGDELASLHAAVDSGPVGAPDRAELHRLLDSLLAEPPSLQLLLRRLVDRVDDPAMARILIDDLAAIARSDGHVDPREEGMLRLVCGALGVDPVTLYEDHERAAADVDASELSRLVRELLDLGGDHRTSDSAAA